MKKFFCYFMGTLLLLFTAGTAFAEPLVITEKKIPDLEVLVDALALKPGESRRNTVSMKVHFNLDSAMISSDAAKFLNVIGKAMQSERLLTFRFDLEGHTDASGGENYNMNLSEKRALAVKNYLVLNCGVTEQRFSALGRGESDPIDTDPNATSNRRVEIYTIR
ncbi:MAG: OmpA family protein [Deltaproteobacteria bacterium]|nr:OmpA family protein [Candidatus Tharpella aukensis]